jgi:hypothetical protein
MFNMVHVEHQNFYYHVLSTLIANKLNKSNSAYLT